MVNRVPLIFLLIGVLLAPLSPSPSCSYLSSKPGLVMTCTGLNTTADISEEEDNTAQSVAREDSRIDCVELSHFGTFHHLEEIKVTKSGLKQAFCRDNGIRHKEAVQQWKLLKSLDLSFNSISSLGSSFTSLHSMQRIDLSNNIIKQIDMNFTPFINLKYVNISNNLLSEDLQPTFLETLPASIDYLDLTGNLWSCSPSLSWLYPWSLGVSRSLQDQLDKVTCNVINSHQVSPLLQVMQYYTTNLNPSCPSKCSCYFYHFATTTSTPTSYTVLVNCSMKGLTTFPTVPPHTTILDLSHNNISDMAYNSLNLSHQNYAEVTGLILSYNNLTTIHTKLTKIKLHRVFKADHNQISVIPYDFSLLLQSYPKNKITLGSNQWRCSCHAEITSLVRFFS